MRVVLRLAVLGLVLGSASTTAVAAPVVAFGDSWADQSWDELQASLMAAGINLTVSNHAVSGQTAAHYATVDPTAITAAVAANPDAQWVYLSLTGNDVFLHHQMGGTNAGPMNDMNLRTILNNLFAQYPDIRVVMFGYDRTNFVQSAACMMQADSFFGMGWTQGGINMINETQTGDVMAAVAASYQNAHYVPLWGTLQAAGGVTVSQNDPSPAALLADCFHASSQGYRHIHDALVAQYWSATAAPTAAFTDDGTPLCVGNTITFTDMSTGDDYGRWFVDGVDQGTNATLALPLMTAGSIDVTRRVVNRVWRDESTQTIVVNPCTPDAGVPDAGVPDAGNRDGGEIPRDGGPVPPRDGGDPMRDGGDPLRDGGPAPRDGGGPVRDGGDPLDGGVVRDAGPGVTRDAGPRDGGVIGFDAGPAPTGSWELSGGCTTAPRAQVSWLLLIAGALLFVRRRRR